MMTSDGRVPVRQGRDDVLDTGLGGEFDGRLGEAEPIGAQAHLVHRFLARDVDDPLAAQGQRRAGLDQQGRLADAGLAAEQQDRAGDEAAARDAVEFVDPGPQAAMRMVGDAEFAEREDAAFPGAARGLRADADRARILDHRVPGPAGLASTLPARRDVAAGLADERTLGFGHVARSIAAGNLSNRTKRDHEKGVDTASVLHLFYDFKRSGVAGLRGKMAEIDAEMADRPLVF